MAAPMKWHWRHWTVLIGLGVVLRPLFTSNSAILLRSGSMDVAAPLLTALPVLAMAVASAYAGRLLLRRGVRWTVLASGFALMVGAGVRLGGDMLSLIAGSCFAACAIGALNVALPLLARTLFPGQLALATGLYTAALCGGAAGGAAFTAAMVDEGWTGGEAAAIWSLPALGALLICTAWLPRRVVRPPTRVPPRHPWIAAAVFMGAQGALAYCVFGWLTPMLQLRGVGLADAGGLAGWSMIAQVPGCLIMGWTMQRPWLRAAAPFAAPLIAGFALAGMQFAPLGLLLPLAVIQGIAQGALIALAMLFISARPSSDGEIAILSARVQGSGYAVAAVGPQILGVLLARQSLFAMPFILALSFAAALAAIFARRSLSFGSGGLVHVDHRVVRESDEGSEGHMI